MLTRKVSGSTSIRGSAVLFGSDAFVTSRVEVIAVRPRVRPRCSSSPFSSAADVKWYVAEAQEYVTEPEQVWDEVFHLVCAALDI